MRTEKFTLDRFEGEFAVCISESGDVLELPSEKFVGMPDGVLVLCTFDGEGLLISAELLANETERIKKENSERLRRLFDRSKKNN